MNIYFIYPNDFEPTNFHHLLKMLKVTAIYSLIPKNDRINPDDYLDLSDAFDYLDMGDEIEDNLIYLMEQAGEI